MPLGEKAIEINPTLLNYLNSHLFTRKDHEDPYNHLDDFYALIGTLGLQDGEEKAACMKIFPFSFMGEAKDWLKSHPNQSFTSWEDLKKKFLIRFFPPTKFISAKTEISTFRQGSDETLYVVGKDLNHY
jgi:hypothetical protein